MPAPAFSDAFRKIARGRVRDARPQEANPNRIMERPVFSQSFQILRLLSSANICKISPCLSVKFIGPLTGPFTSPFTGPLTGPLIDPFIGPFIGPG